MSRGGSTQPLRAVGSERGELASLLGAIARGDRTALRKLYDRTAPRLLGISLRLLGNAAEAEEVVQDIFLTVWRKAGAFNAERASAMTWLSVLTRNRSLDRLRRRRLGLADLAEAQAVPDDSPSAFDLAVGAEDAKRLHHCLDQLDERARTMVRTAFLDGATYPELAARVGVPHGTMKSIIRRALMSLRKCLEA